jgi:hypothetical protein
MNDVLKQELTDRKPVLVCLGGQDYPLAFPIHAVILYKQSTGDNLFDGECWKKIAPLEDPERFLACLWAGLHVSSDDKWTCPFTLAQLGRLVDFTNVGSTCGAIAEALASYFPAARESQASEEASPKPQELQEVMAPADSEEASVNSGPSLVSTSA